MHVFSSVLTNSERISSRRKPQHVRVVTDPDLHGNRDPKPHPISEAQARFERIAEPIAKSVSLEPAEDAAPGCAHASTGKVTWPLDLFATLGTHSRGPARLVIISRGGCRLCSTAPGRDVDEPTLTGRRGSSSPRSEKTFLVTPLSETPTSIAIDVPYGSNPQERVGARALLPQRTGRDRVVCPLRPHGAFSTEPEGWKKPAHLETGIHKERKEKRTWRYYKGHGLSISMSPSLIIEIRSPPPLVPPTLPPDSWTS